MDPITKHQQEFRRRIVFPAVLGGFLLFGIVIVPLFLLTITDSMSTGQLSSIASFMITICILLPLALVLLVVNVVFIVMAWGVSQVPAAVTNPLEMVRSVFHEVTTRIEAVMKQLAKPVVEVNSRLAKWGTMLCALLPDISPEERVDHE